MSTKKQKFVYIFALVLSFALGMLTMTGCAYFSQEKVAGTVTSISKRVQRCRAFFMSSPRITCGNLTALKATLPCTAEFWWMWNSRTASTRRSPTKWRGRLKLPATASNTPKNTVCSVLPEQESITSKTTSPRKERLQNENC